MWCGSGVGLLVSAVCLLVSGVAGVSAHLSLAKEAVSVLCEVMVAIPNWEIVAVFHFRMLSLSSHRCGYWKALLEGNDGWLSE